MSRLLWATALAALACAGCLSQTTRLHYARGLERLYTPSSDKTSKAAEAHVDATAVAPPPSCDDVRIKAYNHQVCCTGVKDVVAPESVDALARLIEETRTDPARKQLRVVANSHTSNEQICTDGVGVSIANFDQIHGFRRHNGVEYVDVDAGVRLSELNRWLYEHNRTIGYTTIGFRGITIGGGIATAVHGSSLVHPSVLSSRLEYIELVDGTGKRHDFYKPPAPPELSTAQLQKAVFDPHAAPDPHVADRERFRALAANVGMLGVVTRVGLRVEPRFNLDVTVDFDKDDVLWTKGVEALVGRCDWGQLVWLPRANRIVRMCGMRTADEAEPGAANTLLQPHLDPGALGAFKELMEDTIANGAWLCDIETERYRQLKSYPPFVHDCCCKKKYARHVVGPADLMMSSEMTDVQSELPEIDYEVAVPLADVPDALRRVKEYARANRLCMPLIGAFLRFSPVEDHTLIGHSVTDEGAWKNQKVMFLEFVVYVLHTPAPDDKREQSWQEHHYYGKYRELALQLIEHDHARPHWGKNQTPLFVLHKEVDTAYAARLHEFHCWVRKLDPDNRFANDFTRKVGLTPPQASTPTKWDDCKRASDEEDE